MSSVVSLCDLTGNIVRPWAEAGYNCLCLDVEHPIRSDDVESFDSGGRIVYRWADVRSVTPSDLPDDTVMMFAFPPCTHLTVSGSRDWSRKGLQPLIDGLQLVEACRRLCEWGGWRWMLENPVGRLSKAWRAPDHSFQPNEYGDTYTKRTCLWVGGGFVVPQVSAITEPVDGSKMWKIPPSGDQARLRSETPEGFAQAVFEANDPWVA